MRTYSYSEKWQSLLNPEVLALLAQIHEHKGRQSLFLASKTNMQIGTLTRLMEMAKIQSTEASNRIEGIYTSSSRLRMLINETTTPQNRNEQEIAGCRDVLATILESYEHISPTSNVILQLHRDLYTFSGFVGGIYKSTNNVISEIDADGIESVRFRPVEAWETPEAMKSLCTEYIKIIEESKVDPLLIIPMFVLDFLCIHPFLDGNGRMSRLLTLLVLYRAEYIVGKYISIEKIIEQSKESYYEALYDSSRYWHEEKNDYKPFVVYLLGAILFAYRELESRMNILVTKKLLKPEKIANVIKNHLGKITKSEILEKCPDISMTTVERALKDLLHKGDIVKIGKGRGTSYAWNWEKE